MYGGRLPPVRGERGDDSVFAAILGRDPRQARVAQGAGQIFDALTPAIVDGPDHGKLVHRAGQGQRVELAYHLPDLLVVAVVEQVLEGHAAQVVAGQEAQFVGDAVRVLQPHGMLLAAVVPVAEPVCMTSLVVHDVAAALACAQGKDDLFVSLELLSPALRREVGKRGHSLDVGHERGVGPSQVYTTRREEKLQFLAVDLAHGPADQLIHPSVRHISLRVGDRRCLQRVRGATQCGPVKDAGVPLIVSHLARMFHSYRQDLALLVELVGQLGDKLAERAAQGRVDGPIVDLDAVKTVRRHRFHDGLDVRLPQRVIHQQVVNQVVAHRPALVPVGDDRHDGKRRVRVDTHRGRAHDPAPVAQGVGTGVQLHDHPMGRLGHIGSGHVCRDDGWQEARLGHGEVELFRHLA